MENLLCLFVFSGAHLVMVAVCGWAHKSCKAQFCCNCSIQKGSSIHTSNLSNPASTIYNPRNLDAQPLLIICHLQTACQISGPKLYCVCVEILSSGVHKVSSVVHQGCPHKNPQNTFSLSHVLNSGNRFSSFSAHYGKIVGQSSSGTPCDWFHWPEVAHCISSSLCGWPTAIEWLIYVVFYWIASSLPAATAESKRPANELPNLSDKTLPWPKYQ